MAVVSGPAAAVLEEIQRLVAATPSESSPLVPVRGAPCLGGPRAPTRPGVLYGPYPERDEKSPNWLERVAHRAQGFGQRHLSNFRGGGFHRVSTAVQDWEDYLRQRCESDLALRVKALRQALRVRGFETGLVVESFALVREMAWRRLGLRHHDVQIIGGWAMTSGMLAEMETGEGKTLTATLPACTAALAGVPVHVVSVNDYLVSRDAQWMRPIYEGLGLTVGTITEESDPLSRQQAYACDITYCSNKQLAFDYLKDRLTLGQSAGLLRLQLEQFSHAQPRIDRLLLRGLCFAIVDEADSVLVDEARTPLIISRPSESSDEQRTYVEALSLAESLNQGADYLIETRHREVRFTDAGTKRIEQLSTPLGGLWRGRRRREELVRQALTALNLFERDRHYLVREGEVQIIDEFTGRTMADRSWERGLHQLIEAKEGLEMSARKDTLARISYQRFFRRYLRLAGMSGTAREVSEELWSVYGLKVAKIPPNRPVQRRCHGDTLFARAQDKWQAVVETIAQLHKEGRPVLVGTRSVGASEHLSRLLEVAGLAHRVLNARQDHEEAEIVQRAGEIGQITVATNMAGRGTDIQIGKDVVELGGLQVLATERHEAGRIDRQLFGRCARQGDPGAYWVFMSLEDELFEVYCPGWVRRVAEYATFGGKLQGVHASWFGKRAQRGAERQHARVREELLRVDERLGQALAFAGRSE